MMRSRADKSAALQWGLVMGLLMFSFVALSGIAFGVEPFVIAQRALCSAVVTSLVAQLAVSTLLMTIKKKR